LLLEASQRLSLLYKKELESKRLRKDLVGSIDRICLLETQIACSEFKNAELSKDPKKTKEASALTDHKLSTLKPKVALIESLCDKAQEELSLERLAFDVTKASLTLTEE
jgi:hypothetical protein